MGCQVTYFDGTSRWEPFPHFYGAAGRVGGSETRSCSQEEPSLTQPNPAAHHGPKIYPERAQNVSDARNIDVAAWTTPGLYEYQFLA